MATLESLRLAILPRARWLTVGGEPVAAERATPTARTARDKLRAPAVDRELSWVRLMRARVPAFDALEPGDVAIVPLAAVSVVAPDRDAVAAFVRAVADAEIAGLVVVGDPTGVTAAAVSEQLVGAAASAGLAILDAGPGDAAAIERSAIGFLVNDRAELERQATLLETRLQQVALAGAGPAGLAAAIAGFLGRAVAVEGRRGTPLAVHAPPDVADGAAAVTAYHERPRTAARRIALPIPGDDDSGASPGALALLGDRPLTELERVATSRIAGLVALELARDEAVDRARETARREPLPADGPPWVVVVARQAAADRPSGPSSAERTGAPDAAATRADGREQLRRDLRGLASARRMTLRGDALSVELRTVLAAPPDDPSGLVLAGRIAAFLGRTVAVSTTFTDPAARSGAEADARATLEAAERLETPPRVARADRLPAYRLLGNLHNVPDGARQARALLEPVLRSRADIRREHLSTLRAVLDQPGLGEAASVLGVHRNTVAYRIRRIEALTGWQLSDAELRFPLALALRLVQED
jgi:PucR family transcriptional regulator, purine catabolism regulatory protein